MYRCSPREPPKKKRRFIDASETGDDVFFITPARLSVTDEDDELDVYDTRVDGVPASLPVINECLGEACQAAPNPPNDPTPNSAAFHGSGNVPSERCAESKRKVTSEGHSRCVAKKHKRKEALTQSQEEPREPPTTGGRVDEGEPRRCQSASPALIALAATATALLGLLFAGSASAAPSPWWQVLDGSRPSHLWEASDNVQEIETESLDSGAGVIFAAKVEVGGKAVGCLGTGVIEVFGPGTAVTANQLCESEAGFPANETAAELETMLEGPYGPTRRSQRRPGRRRSLRSPSPRQGRGAGQVDRPSSIRR